MRWRLLGNGGSRGGVRGGGVRYKEIGSRWALVEWGGDGGGGGGRGGGGSSGDGGGGGQASGKRWQWVNQV